MLKSIVVISSEEFQKHFFSTDHCQNHGLSSSYVPCTHYLPSKVVPREGLESGIINNKEDLLKVFYKNSIEIPNPNPLFQA